jgi:carbamoyl-phosphate synthase small subunit
MTKTAEHAHPTQRARPRGYLVLEDGTEFEGRLFGAEPSLGLFERDRGYGEVIFNTSMTGYQEILTDPSYYGQIVCLTAAHVGNTGMNPQDPESKKIWCSGLVIQSLSESASNWRSTQTLEEGLLAAGIPGLCDVDTRALTRHLRSGGVLRGLVVNENQRSQVPELLKKLPQFEGRDLIREVTTNEPYRWTERKAELLPEGNPISQDERLRVVALDFGIKWNLLDSLSKMGMDIQVLPATATSTEILAHQPHGIFLSNGPGDPTAAPYAAETVRSLVGRVPLFGVCMGHQILALAMGAKTYKLKFGHRGGNQPVKDQQTSRIEISSHNHGYSVDDASLPSSIRVTHRNLNDGTIEGIEVIGKLAFSVQYHPEACPGPHDSIGLFERFVDLMRSNR